MAMTDATAKVVLIPLGTYLVDSGSPDKNSKRFAIVIGTGAITDDDGDFTPASYLPVGYDTVEWCSYEAQTLGTSAAVAPTVAATTFAAEYAGSAATTMNYLMIVSKRV